MPDCFHKAQDDPKYSTLQLQSLLMGVAIGVVLTILLQLFYEKVIKNPAIKAMLTAMLKALGFNSLADCCNPKAWLQCCAVGCAACLGGIFVMLNPARWGEKCPGWLMSLELLVRLSALGSTIMVICCMFMPSLGGRGVGVVYSWYLVLMAQGFLYFLTESLLAFGSFKASAGGADGAEKDKKGAGFRKQHMQWELCAFVFIVSGYVIMLLHDAKMGQLSSYPNPVVGAQRILCHVTVALFSFQVYATIIKNSNWAKRRKMYTWHDNLGLLVFILGTLVLVLGLYIHSREQYRTNPYDNIFSIPLQIAGSIMALIVVLVVSTVAQLKCGTRVSREAEEEEKGLVGNAVM